MRIFLPLLLTCITNLWANTGSVTGTVPLPKAATKAIPLGKYRGKISGKVAPATPKVAAIWLENPTLTAPPKPPNVVLAQTNYQFTKSLLVIPKGTTVTFPNNDPDYHNIYSLSKAKSFDLGRYKSEEKPAPSVRFDKLGFIALRCEIHDHMKADIIVVNSPYSITTDAKGKFHLKNIPPGSYTLHAQIDKKTSWKIPIQISAKKTTTVKFPSR